MSNEHIEVNCVGETTGTKYFGRFEIKKYLTQKEKGEASRLYDKYVYGITEDVGQRAVYHTLAQLAQHIVSTDAAWWQEGGMDLKDDAPVIELLKQLRERQMAWKAAQAEKKAE